MTMEERIPWYYRNPADSTEMVLIPGGWFQMGSGDEDPHAYSSEKPPHLHYVSPFYLGITCVTRAQFETFVKETGYKGGEYPGTGNDYYEQWGTWKNDPPAHPVRSVNWHDARAYCAWADLRLPTEAEWELAARGYRSLRYPWGHDWEDGKRVCWYNQKGPTGATTPVFGHPEGVSPFGTFQQSGNLWEWCEDAYESDVYKRYAKEDFAIPTEGNSRVLRGGSWLYEDPRLFRGAYRNNYSPKNRNNRYGFRAARDITL
jgi:formylglycine-generating enzyme